MGWALAVAAVAFFEVHLPCARFYPIQHYEYIHIADEYLLLTLACPVAGLERSHFNLPD